MKNDKNPTSTPGDPILVAYDLVACQSTDPPVICQRDARAINDIVINVDWGPGFLLPQTSSSGKADDALRSAKYIQIRRERITQRLTLGTSDWPIEIYPARGSPVKAVRRQL